MEASLSQKRHLESEDEGGSKRRNSNKKKKKGSSGEGCFRILCPADKIGGVIGKGGAIIRQVREETGARIRIDDFLPGCDDRVILVSADDPALAHRALLRVFETILKAHEEDASSPVACRLLANHLPNISHDSAANVRVLPPDHLPPCAAPGDTLIQITGTFADVKKALLSLHMDSDQPEEEPVFKVLCPVDKVGSLIGKGGSIIRAMQNETGASIFIPDSAPDYDERIVVISARENPEQRHSAAQEALIRVVCRIAEIGFEPGAAVVSRLLVHARHMSCLFGNGGILIAELRRLTGASIRIFPREQSPKYGAHAEEVLQVIGSMQSVQDALFEITTRLRDIMFPMKPHISNIAPRHFPSYSEIQSPPFRPMHDPGSPSYRSPAGFPHDRAPHFYDYERQGHVLFLDRPPSPGRWGPQAVNSRYTAGRGNLSGGFSLKDGNCDSEATTPNLPGIVIEVVIPEMLLKHVYGENSGNLFDITRISGAKVVVRDPVAGSTEGTVIVSGTPDQARFAQSLIHAFILCEQNT